MPSKSPLYILQISVHGLFRGHNMELGADADTGGQTTYVVELARALGRSPEVEYVDLLTRQIFDSDVSMDYAQPEEILGNGVRILRVPCGPRRYIKKESLWPYLDQMVDRALYLLCQQKRFPDVIHTHYADAGYVGQQLSLYLGIPQIHTGHSLGRTKKQGLLDKGLKETALNKRYNFSRRIAVEEDILSHASMVITSTRQEVTGQYGQYDNADAKKFLVIPPGVDVSRFSLPTSSSIDETIASKIDRFLDEPKKPIILAVCRPVTSKNLYGLVEAYGKSPELQEKANLVIVAGNRNDIQELDEVAQGILTKLLLQIDKYDLWGKVALPKHHKNDDIPKLYKLAYHRRGVLVNPTFWESFGLTLLEAAASGVPIVTTECGGPKDIIENLRSGAVVDPYDVEDIARGLLRALSDKRQWRVFSRRGMKGIKQYYSWDKHAEKYVKTIRRVLAKDRKRQRYFARQKTGELGVSIPRADKLFISDIDNTLIGHKPSLKRLMVRLKKYRSSVSFGVATGRSLESTLEVLKEWQIPSPNIYITSVGTEINYGADLLPDKGWQQHISYLWRRKELVDALKNIPGLTLQEPKGQRTYKISYYVDPDVFSSVKDLHRYLSEKKLRANLVYSHDAYLDVIPIRASKGRALRYLAAKWGIPLKNFFVAGDSGNDLDMLNGDTSAIVVGNYSPELLKNLRKRRRVFYAKRSFAKGLLDGLDYYQEQIEASK